MKKLLSILMLLAMLFAMTACGETPVPAESAA